MDSVTKHSRDDQSLTPPFALQSRADSRASDRTLVNMPDTELEDRSKALDLEKDGSDGSLLQKPHVITKDHIAPDPLARAKLLMWMVINTLATVFIVSSLYSQGARVRSIRLPARSSDAQL